MLAPPMHRADQASTEVAFEIQLSRRYCHENRLGTYTASGQRETPAMSTPDRLIVVMAFDPNDEGELVAAFEPKQFTSEERAAREARTLSTKHAGVIAWSRTASTDVGEYGEPTVLASYGDVPDME